MAITLSVVVPVYSGQDYLESLVAEVGAIREHWLEENAPIILQRLVLVDDNAIDGSAGIIDALAARFPWIEAVHLSRNFGQHPATMAGILHTQEDWVVTLDEDLQHPPSRIPELLRQAISTGADVVYGKPESRIHDAVSRDFTSRTYKRIMEWLTGNKHIRDANSFRLLRGEIARGAAAACAHDTYFDVALSWFTQRIQTVVMPLKDRRYITTKQSGYHFRSLISHARRMLVTSQIKILRTGALLGLSMAILSIAVAILVFLLWLFEPSWIQARGWTSLILTTTFFSGVSFFMIGIVLEYISILLSRSNGRPLFFKVDRSKDTLLADYLSRAVT